MENTEEVWKDFIIVRKGPYWYVRNHTAYVGGTFTMLSAAKKYIDGRIVTEQDRAFKAEVKKIQKMPINKRKKEYEKLCQTRDIS